MSDSSHGLINATDRQNQILSAILTQLKAGIGIVGPSSYTVASLPTTASAGQFAWASNGRKGAEGVGAGTGVPVFYNAATASWFSYLSGVAVTA